MKYNYLFLISVLFLSINFGCKDKEISAEEQAQIDDDIIKNYASGKNLTLQSGPEGLYYIVEKAGTGTAHPTDASVIKVHYKGTLLEDGSEFDSSYGKPPFKFNITQVIKGWQLGIPLMLKGEKTKFFIPSGLAYGKRGSGNSIPENAVLIFDIELVNF